VLWRLNVYIARGARGFWPPRGGGEARAGSRAGPGGPAAASPPTRRRRVSPSKKKPAKRRQPSRARQTGDWIIAQEAPTLNPLAPEEADEIPPHPLAAGDPFPSGALPEPIQSFVRRGARAIGCDQAMLALP